MSSKKCSNCGFVDFAEAENCKRCGWAMSRRSGTVLPAKTAFRVAALTVLLLGGVAYKNYSARQTNQLLAEGERLLKTSSPAAPVSQFPSASDDAMVQREQFARGLQRMWSSQGILRNVVVSTEDAGEKTLVLTADNMTGDDCLIFQGSTYARAAELAGFDTLVCRERGFTGDEWKHRLLPN